MLDFMMVSTKSPKRGVIEIYPKFIIKDVTDLMVRGGDFYAVWDESKKLWSTKEDTAIKLIDRELDRYAEEHKSEFVDSSVHIMHMWDSDSGSIDRWHKYVQKQTRDTFHPLDENVIFADHETVKEDYASKKLTYPLSNCPVPAYDELMDVLYSEDERRKIEWAIGAIASGDSKSIQKFLVLYGSAGTGKSTILNIIQDLFDGYYCVFDAKALGSSNNSFALEPFKTNPLVAIQHDGDLSRIEDNTRLNSLVSHELMTVNEKFKSQYSNTFNCFLFMGTNKPVRITDAKSGIIRRLIDVSPTGKTVPASRYKELVSAIKFELGGIASHCIDIYNENPGAYDNYVATEMLGASNDFYNYIGEVCDIFNKDDSTTLKAAWELYKSYCDEARVPYPYSQKNFKEELKNYFNEFYERYTEPDGTRTRNFYKGFIMEKFQNVTTTPTKTKKAQMIFEETDSIFDLLYANCPAQVATASGYPPKPWAENTTLLSEIDTHKLHYMQPPENLIVIDFDIKDKDGNKSFKLNAEAAAKWPPTYGELSKSGEGIHLHYIYNGDVSQLQRIYDRDIEVKVFTGDSSLRRKLTKCNGLPIASISSGLPLKEEKKVFNKDIVMTEQRIRNSIAQNLRKEVHSSTKCSVDFIEKILADAYDSGIEYDVEDMFQDVYDFAANSTNHSRECLRAVGRMNFSSKKEAPAPSEPVPYAEDAPLVFFDVEVFPNLFIIVWKAEGKRPVKMINPTPQDVEKILQFKLVGFNCRRYDNHILYARAFLHYTNEQLFELSQAIVTDKRINHLFRNAYDISYTDVYDFMSDKKSLKKMEIELGISHQECGLPWNEPVDEKDWNMVADYCVNDVVATEAVFNAKQADFTGRKILAALTGMTVNDTTNTLTAKFIFGDERHPQSVFNYRKLSEPVGPEKYDILCRSFERTTFRMFDRYGQPMYEDYDPSKTYEDGVSLLPFFPGYTFEKGVSTYLDNKVGEGGNVYAEPDMHWNVGLLDVASMHPHSITGEWLFGPYTKRFKDIMDARMFIKHKDFDSARTMLNGALAPYLDDESQAKDLAQALKIAINSVYGLTAAKFENQFRDPRNIDNIVAKKGALFMENLKHEVQKRGFRVAHIKTDSIKIPGMTDEIKDFCMAYAREFGYEFEHEATYEKMCLVNDAVYIAKYAYGGEGWTATGTQFAVPYVFKTLFSHEPIEFKDMCETKSVTDSAIYLDMNQDLPDVTEFERIKTLREKAGKGGRMTKPEMSLLEKYAMYDDEGLDKRIAEGHNYRFVGKVGQFCPIKVGCGGGDLLREKDGKMYAVTGSKNFRWLESEVVQMMQKQADIDETYYKQLVDDAVFEISQYGDFEVFSS